MNIKTAQRLYDLRKKHGYSQEELAYKLGVSRQAVSKWERSESSPDTDNLIELAKLYGVTLDELLNGDDAIDAINDNKVDEQSDNGFRESAPRDADEINDANANTDYNKKTNKILFDKDGIQIEDEDGSKIIIGKGKGIHIEDCGEDKTVPLTDDNDLKTKRFRLLKEVVSTVWTICLILAYVLAGCYTSNGWTHYWFLFILIPVLPSMVDAIYKKDPSHFVYPFLVAAIYCALGMFLHLWHPMWVLFLTIPVYYSIAKLLNKLCNKKNDNNA